MRASPGSVTLEAAHDVGVRRSGDLPAHEMHYHRLIVHEPARHALGRGVGSVALGSFTYGAKGGHRSALGARSANQLVQAVRDGRAKEGLSDAFSDLCGPEDWPL